MPDKSDPYSLRQAFLRESARLDRTSELLRELKGGHVVEKQEKTPTPTKKNLDVPKNESFTPISDDNAEERVRKMTGNVVENGLVTIIKHADGSFEY